VPKLNAKRTEYAFAHQSRTYLQEVTLVHPQDVYSGRADRGPPHDNRTFPFEVFTPAVFSRIEEPHDSPGSGIDSRDIRALPDVAVQA
jgi:hypothetical protein